MIQESIISYIIQAWKVKISFADSEKKFFYVQSDEMLLFSKRFFGYKILDSKTKFEILL